MTHLQSTSVLAVAIALAGCGSSSSQQTTSTSGPAPVAAAAATTAGAVAGGAAPRGAAAYEHLAVFVENLINIAEVSPRIGAAVEDEIAAVLKARGYNATIVRREIGEYTRAPRGGGTELAVSNDVLTQRSAPTSAPAVLVIRIEGLSPGADQGTAMARLLDLTTKRQVWQSQTARSFQNSPCTTLMCQATTIARQLTEGIARRPGAR